MSSKTSISNPIWAENLAQPVDVGQVDLLIEELFGEGSDADAVEAGESASRWASALFAAGVCVAWGNLLFTDGRVSRRENPGVPSSESEGDNHQDDL